MLRCLTQVLRFEFKDVKSKTIVEKLRRAKLQQGVHPSDIDTEELARESGLAPSPSADVQGFVQEKEALLGLLREQRVRRIARREAFLEWQAGQREKGAAHRLLRQSRKAEKYKRRHYHAASGRMLPLSLDVAAVSAAAAASANGVCVSQSPHRPMSSTDFLRGGVSTDRPGIPLSLSRK